MTIIEIKKKFYNIPTCWNELTPEQLLQVFDTIYSTTYKPEQILLKLLKILTGMSYRQWFTLKAEDIEEYIYLVGFLFEPTTNFTKQLIPAYENMHGPSGEISNLLMGEFVFSEHYFMGWDADKENVSMLNQLVAVLYRPAKKLYDFEMNPDGDCRVPFNENICSWHGEHTISKWPMNAKLAIATWYAGCRQKMVDDNDDVFGGNGEPAKYGLISIMRSIAKEGAHGDFDKIEKMAVNLVMIELNEVVADGKRLEKQTK